MSENRIKKAVIREDLLSITNDFRKAIILNQFIYWSERVSDADKFIEKENEVARNNGEEERELFYGWIYKTAEELSDEVMLGLSASQIRRYVNDLVDMGYISKRNNPKYKWDRSLQYRVNLVKIAKDLKKNGFPLSDYKIDIPDDENTIAHPCAINGVQMENQSQSDERAIPENTNIDYYTENTYTENTLKDSPTEFNSPKGALSPTGLNTSKKIDAQAQNKKSKWVAVRNQIVSVMNKLGYDSDTEMTEGAIEVFRHYYAKYRNKTKKEHPILNENTMTNVLRNYISFSDKYGVDCDFFVTLIEEHFENNYGMDIDWNIQHFMTEGILEILTARYASGDYDSGSWS